MTNGSLPGRRTLLAAFLVIVAGALVLGLRWGGPVPYLTPDTINDFKFIQDCCVFHGIGTSVGSMVHGGNWLHMKALAEWLGVSDVAQHWILHLLLALALGGMVVVGARLRGIGTGLLSVVLVLAIYRLTQDFRLDMTYNHRPLPLLGVMFLVFSLLAVETGRRSWLALAGIVVAVATNIHTQAILLLPSLLLVGCLVAPGRLLSVVIAGLSFLAMAFFTSPGSWLHNISSFGAGGRFQAGAAEAIQNPVLIACLLSAVGVSVLAVRTLRDPLAGPADRGRVLVLLAAVLPRAVGFVVLVLLGVITSADKYLVDGMPAVALGLAWTAVELAAIAARHLRLGLSPLPGFAWWAPVVVAGLLVAWPPFERLGRSPDGFPVAVRADVEALYQALVVDRGWNAMHLVRSLKGPRDIDLLDAVVTYHPGPWGPAVPGDDSAVMVFKVDAPALPDPLPAGWQVLNRERNAALVLIETTTWLDWSRFRVCVGPADAPDQDLDCRDGGIAATAPIGRQVEVAVDGMPHADMRNESRLVLRIPVSAPLARGEHELFLPRITDRCGGTVTAVEGAGLRVAPDGRRAWLAPMEGRGATGTLVVEYRLGSPECRGWAYTGFPPFLVEADGPTVAVVEAMLKAQEAVVAGLRQEGSP